ncbi:MAG: SDR family oxidoreductase, partial [Chloroflexota bacterium]|nr:SDR family oxidoreductase [Chloroflexota bacterium]
MSNTNTRVALVTGAGSGLGEATARRFAQAGYAVACVDIKGENAERVANDLGTEAIGIACDASDDRQVSETVNRTVRELGGLDVVVSCAAVDYVVAVNDMAISQWDQVIGVNLRGPFLFAKLAWPHLLERGGGH